MVVVVILGAGEGARFSVEVLGGKGWVVAFKMVLGLVQVLGETRISWSSRLFEHRGVVFFLEGQLGTIR